MRKIAIITLCVFSFYILEFIFFHVGGRWVKPDFLLLLVIFFNIYFGIRYSLYTALLAGMMKDAASTYIFGLHTVSLILCAYLTTVLNQYIYIRGSRSSRLFVVALLCLINVFLHYLLYLIFSSLAFTDMLYHVLLPEIITTLVVAIATFQFLRQCVSRLSV